MKQKKTKKGGRTMKDARNKYRILAVLAIAALMLCLTAGLSSAAAVGGAVELPQTGQTTIYGTGDDGDLKIGAAWPPQRFTDNSNGTITDNLTGLVWLKNANCANAARTWDQALADVTELNTSGKMNGNNCNDTSNGGGHQTDWRLPNVNELESLVHAGEANTVIWLITQGFISVQSNWYWSSTTHASSTAYAWSVNMSYGYVYAVPKTNNFYVWPVRSGAGAGTVELPRTG